MYARMMRIILFGFVFWFLGQSLFSQPYTTRDNFAGNWEDPESWDPVWTNPIGTIYGEDVYINGYIHADSSLEFNGSASTLYINDTLIINGNLHLDNNNSLIINDGGILIIKGNLTINNMPVISNGGYLIVTGNFVNNSSNYGGSFTSTRDPSRVFIGGTVPVISDSSYPVLDCSDTANIHYAYSNCSYGNGTDLMNDPIYIFFFSLCAQVEATSNSPVCEGDSINLNSSVINTSTDGLSYSWSGPANFTSTEQNPVFPASDISKTGQYIVSVTSPGCAIHDTINITVDEKPVAVAGNNSPVCEGETFKLTSGGGISYKWIGPDGYSGEGQNIDLVGNSSTPGLYQVTATAANGCTDTATTIVVVNIYPVADAGPDQILDYVHETSMNALPVTSDLTGEWSLVSGAGSIAAIHSPSSSITGLQTGNNKFMWTVRNGNCSDADDVLISVHDLFIPSVITPNDDGINDFFQISGAPDKTELVIFNRWGIIEYSSDNYLNEWDGRNSSNNLLQNDTYFYIVKYNNGKIKKGAVLIKR